MYDSKFTKVGVAAVLIFLFMAGGVSADVVVTDSGQVGINTSPSSWSQLDVNGAVYTNSGLYFGTPMDNFLFSGDSEYIVNSFNNDGDVRELGLSFYTTGTERVRIDSNGNVGIGKIPGAWFSVTSPDNPDDTVELKIPLDVNGLVRASNISLDSDERLKDDIKTMDDALDKIMRLRGVSYKLKYKELNALKKLRNKNVDKSNDRKTAALADGQPDTNTPDTGNSAVADVPPKEAEGKNDPKNPESVQQFGLIAQEVEEIFPEAVLTDQDGYKSITYISLIAPIIESIKTLKAENDQLKAKNEELEERLAVVEKLFENRD